MVHPPAEHSEVWSWLLTGRFLPRLKQDRGSVCVWGRAGRGGGGGAFFQSALLFPLPFSWRRLDITEILLTGPLNQLIQNTFPASISNSDRYGFYRIRYRLRVLAGLLAV